MLFDDEVVGVRFDHALDVLDLVAGKDAELPWVPAQSFILGRPQGYDSHAGGVCAFAHEADFVAVPTAGLQLLDPLVDLAEEDLVLG